MQIENIFKLVELAGNQHRYQYMVAICCFLFWCNTNILDFGLGILETTPKIKYIVQETGEVVETHLDYELCEKKNNYTIIERPKYSLVSELGIECDQLKVSLLGTLESIGLLLGALTYSYITKALGQKNSLLISNFIFVLVLGLSIVIKNYYYVCFTMLICPYMCNIISYSTMVLFSEIISEKRKSIFNTFINSGLGLGGLFYTAFFYGIQYWWGVFSVCVGIGVLLEIFVMFFIFNSFYDLNKKKDFKGIMKVLRFIAKINGKLKYFNNKIKTEQYQGVINEIDSSINHIKEEIDIQRISNLAFDKLFEIQTQEEKTIDNEQKKEKREDDNKENENLPIEKKEKTKEVLLEKNEEINQENKEEIKEVLLDKIEETNKVPIENKEGTDEVPIEDKNPTIIPQTKDYNNESNITSSSQKTKPGLLDLFKYSSVRTPFLLFSFFWFSTNILYGGLTINLKNLPGVLFTNSIIFFSIETPAYFVLGWIMNTKLLGRKYTLILFTALSSIDYGIIHFFYDNDFIQTIFFLITRFYLACAFSTFYTFALESYPLSIAQLAYGINGACNCLGGVVLPFLIEYIPNKALFLLLCIIGAVCVCLQFILKETRGTKVREIIKEIEEKEN